MQNTQGSFKDVFILTGKRKKYIPRRTVHVWEANIKMDLKEMG